MTKLSYRKRMRMRKQQFACPRQLAYPIYDKAHVINARVRTKQHGLKCKEQKRNICRAAKRFGLLSKKYERRQGWVTFCRRR